MKFKIKISQSAKEIVDDLSVKELLNQVLCPGYPYNLYNYKLDDFGSLFLHSDSSENLKKNIKAYKDVCKIPPFIVSDFEAGAGAMILDSTKFPSFMALSETKSEELVYEVGKITALEAGKLGFNWTFSPVIDITKVFINPIVSTRGMGSDVDEIIKYAGAYVKGLQDHQMIASIKHFPGDGYSAFDQHLTTTTNPLSMEDWYQESGKAFQYLIDQGAMCVMPGHISLPAYDDPDEHGLYPPATLSKKLLQGLLRGELGFDGLIVSDAINMGGAVGYMNYFDACSACLEAGCDVLLFPVLSEDFYKEMYQQIDKGNLSVETLKERATRILSLKMQLGLFDEIEDKITYDLKNHQETANQVIEKSIKIIRDRHKILPFEVKKDTRVLHVGIMNSIDEHQAMLSEFKTKLLKYTDHVDQLLDPGPGTLFEKAYSKSYDLIVCSIGNRIDYGLNEGSLSGKVARNMMGGWTKLGIPVIFVAHYHPYTYLEYEAQTDTIINTYGHIEGSIDKVLEIIFEK